MTTDDAKDWKNGKLYNMYCKITKPYKRRANEHDLYNSVDTSRQPKLMQQNCNVYKMLF